MGKRMSMKKAAAAEAPVKKSMKKMGMKKSMKKK